jgi:hypothetical protein
MSIQKDMVKMSNRHVFTDREGVSIIVGALMLTLIVIVAASSFMIFITQRQESIQKEREISLERQQEKIQINKIEPIINSTVNNKWKSINFTIASIHSKSSNILLFKINDEPVRTYKIWSMNRTTNNYELSNYDYKSYYKLKSMEQINVLIDLDYDLFISGFTILSSDSIKIEVDTARTNTFSNVFIPPTAIININIESLWNGTNYEDLIILDGSDSEQNGNGYLVGWKWHINNVTANQHEDINLTGKKTKIEFSQNSINHFIILTVTNNFGMIGSDSIIYYH